MSEEDRHRNAVVRRLADLLFLPANLVSPHEKALIDEILGRLVVALAPGQRARLAHRICALSDPPRRLTRLLAADSPELAQLFLERAELFNDAELVALIRETGPAHHALIARRPTLGPAVAGALIATNRDEITAAVVANMGAVLAGAHFPKLMEMSRTNERLQSLLLARTDLPAECAHEMFWWAGPQVRAGILHRYSMERRLLAEAVADLKWADVTAPADVDWAFRLTGALRPRFSLQEEELAVLADWIARPDDKALRLQLAEVIAVAPDTMDRIAQDRGGEPYVIFLKAFGLTLSQFRQMGPHIAPRLAEPDQSRLERLETLFGSISTDWADLVLRQWDRQTAPADSHESRLH